MAALERGPHQSMIAHIPFFQEDFYSIAFSMLPVPHQPTPTMFQNLPLLEGAWVESMMIP